MTLRRIAQLPDVPMTPDQLAAWIRSETVKWAKDREALRRKAGLTVALVV